MAGLLGIVKRDNAFHDVFRYFGFTVENVVNIVKCRMCHILPNVPKLPDINVTYITEYAIYCRICQNYCMMPGCCIKIIVFLIVRIFHNSIVTVDFFKIKSVYICVRESDCNRVC